jgi:TonB family protein
MNSEREIRKAWERDRAYNRRILKIVPVAFAIVLLLFLTSDQVSLTDLDKHVGWKGEMRLLPEISIIPDDDPFDAIQSDGLPPVMTSMDLDLTEGPDVPKQKLVSEKEPDDAEIPELSHEDLLRITTRPRQRDVPYSSNYIILKMVEPEYPIYELENEIEGSVTVELFVNENGQVEMASVVSSIGPKSFEESSLRAVRQFVFQPPVRGGVPSSMWIKFLIKFRIYN